MLRKIIIACITASVLVPAFAYAQDSSAVSTSGLAQISSKLHQGDRGDEVKILQALLATDTTVFPEANITGFFGPQTQRAVKRFQKKQGLEQVGKVGPRTLSKLNSLLHQFPLMFESTSSMSASANVSGAASTSFGMAGHFAEGEDRPHLCLPPALGNAIQQFVKEDGTTMLPPCMKSDWNNGTGSSTPPMMSTSMWPIGSSTWPSQENHGDGHLSGTSSFNNGDFMTECKNPWASTPENIKWPKGLPCPKPVASSTAPTPFHSESTENHSNIQTTSSPTSDGTKKCPVPWEMTDDITMGWPANLPCPPKIQRNTLPPKTGSTTDDARLPAAGNLNWLMSSTSCLGMLHANSSKEDFAKAVTLCGPSTWQPNPAEMVDKKMCTITLNGNDWKFPFPSDRACPMAVIGTVGGTAVPGPGTTTGMCNVRINGNTLSVPWPSNIPCTGTI